MMCIKKCQALEFIQTSIKPKQNQSELNGLSCYMSIISQFFKDIIVAGDIQKNSQVRLPLKLIRKWPQEKKNSGRVRKWKEKGRSASKKAASRSQRVTWLHVMGSLISQLPLRARESVIWSRALNFKNYFCTNIYTSVSLKCVTL